MTRQFFDRFFDLIATQGDAAAQMPDVVLATNLTHSLTYVPFEHITRTARLCIVGVTPGPDQVSTSYAGIRGMALRDVVPLDQMQERIKRFAAFGGQAMRPNLVRLLNGTGLSELLGLDDANRLWSDEQAHLIHLAYVIPHAAFHAKGKPFNGSFDDIMTSSVLKECFELDFVSSLAELSPDCMFLALGPTPLEALRWCIEHRLIAEDRLLGAFPHPSANAGSQTDLYLGIRNFEDLNERDPVRLRDYLIDWAAYLRKRVEILRAEAPQP